MEGLGTRFDIAASAAISRLAMDEFLTRRLQPTLRFKAGTILYFSAMARTFRMIRGQ
jgi:hypothetical protein